MKKVLHISKYYYPFRGGTEQIAQDCVHALIGKYEQKVFCFNDGKSDAADCVDGVDVIRAGCFTKVSSQSLSFSYGKLLKGVMEDFKPNIVIFHYPNPFGAIYILRYLPKRCKLVIYWHLDIVKQKILRNLFIGQNKKLVERATALIATSPPYIQGSPYLSSAREKCVVIPNCVNTERLKTSSDIRMKAAEIRENNKDGIICLAVGRHTEYKGFKYLIRAAHLLDSRFQIYFVGKGEETERLKKEAGDDKKIHFLGFIDDVELKAYFTAMDIFCFPSVTKNEAFGVALAEAMYFGKPAVTFTIPGSGVNYVNLDGVTGLEAPNRDVDAYAEALRRLADDRKLRESMGDAAKKRVEENFLNVQFEDNILSLFDELCGLPLPDREKT